MSKALTTRNSLLAPQLDYWLLDGSSSMQDKWWETLAGMDEFLKVMKSNNIHSHGIAATFDTSDLQCIQRDDTLANWKPFTEDPLGAHFGSTPLYDAINMMGRHLKDLDPPNASIVIVTDGHENASRHTNLDQAKALLNWCRAKGWIITMLGADFENSGQAKALGIEPRHQIGVRKMKMDEAGKTLGEKRARHANGAEDISFSDDEKTKFGGYLGHG